MFYIFDLFINNTNNTVFTFNSLRNLLALKIFKGLYYHLVNIDRKTKYSTYYPLQFDTYILKIATVVTKNLA